MNPHDRESLHAAVFRNTAKDPAWVGYWLARHQQTEDLDEEQLAGKLGITMENLVLVCLCRTPRSDQFREDLRIICQRTGASEEALAGMLRQEATLLHWSEKPPTRETGWLMAASDRPDETPEPPPGDDEQPHDK